MQTRTMSARRNSRAWLRMKPIPLEALSCSAATSATTLIASDWRSATSAGWTAAGQDHVADQLRLGQAEDACGLDELDVDVADRAVDVQVHRERGAEGDDQDLRQLADPEPHDEQRDDRGERDGLQHLDGRVDQVLPRRQRPESAPSVAPVRDAEDRRRAARGGPRCRPGRRGRRAGRGRGTWWRPWPARGARLGSKMPKTAVESSQRARMSRTPVARRARASAERRRRARRRRGRRRRIAVGRV